MLKNLFVTIASNNIDISNGICLNQMLGDLGYFKSSVIWKMLIIRRVITIIKGLFKEKWEFTLGLFLQITK